VRSRGAFPFYALLRGLANSAARAGDDDDLVFDSRIWGRRTKPEKALCGLSYATRALQAKSALMLSDYVDLKSGRFGPR